MKLKNKREKLNKIDKKLTKLLNERFLVVLDIKTIKEDENIDIVDLKREKEVIESNKKYINQEFYEQFIKVYNTIMSCSKELQK